MFYYELPRFSVDLDFDLLEAKKEDLVFDKMKQLLSGYGKLKEASQKPFGLFFTLSYDEKTRLAKNIKVEINKRLYGSRYETLQYLGIPMKVMVKEDMAAHTLVAMSERLGKANRDLFDVWYFLKNRWPINKKIVEQRTQKSYTAFLQDTIDRIKKMNREYILDGLGEVLTEKQKAWVKKNLVDEVLFYLRLALEYNG